MRTELRSFVWFGVLALAALAGSSCVRARAKTVPDAPLEMPAPPPRDVEPNEQEVPPPVPLVEEPARSAPIRQPAPPGRTQPAAPRPDAPKPEAPKPEPPPVETPKPEEPPKPPTTLQTTPTAEEGLVESSIRSDLTRATSDLNRINVRALNSDARQQYDTAKRLITQAQDALRAKNLVFAKTLAEKAAALAVQLAGK